MKLTCSIEGTNRREVSDTLALLAIEIATSEDNNGAGHFGGQGDFDFDLEE